MGNTDSAQLGYHVLQVSQILFPRNVDSVHELVNKSKKSYSIYTNYVHNKCTLLALSFISKQYLKFFAFLKSFVAPQ